MLGPAQGQPRAGSPAGTHQVQLADFLLALDVSLVIRKDFEPAAAKEGGVREKRNVRVGASLREQLRLPRPQRGVKQLLWVNYASAVPFGSEPARKALEIQLPSPKRSLAPVHPGFKAARVKCYPQGAFCARGT